MITYDQPPKIGNMASYYVNAKWDFLEISWCCDFNDIRLGSPTMMLVAEFIKKKGAAQINISRERNPKQLP